MVLTRLKDSISKNFHKFLLVIIYFCLVFPTQAEQLPLKKYSVADGLASNFVNDIYQDRKGFLWFATGEGLSQFDGYNFRNFDESDGLPPSAIRFITEDDNGNLWVATWKGVSRLIESDSIGLPKDGIPTKRFVSFNVIEGDSIQQKVRNQVSRILFHPDGSMWCLTDLGLYKASNPLAETVTFETIFDRDTTFSSGAFRDKKGNLWFGVGDELVEIRGTEIINHGSIGLPFPKDMITDIKSDKNGRLLVSDVRNLFEFLPPDETRPKGVFQTIFSVEKETGLSSFLFDNEDNLWIETQKGLIKFADGKPLRFDDFGEGSFSSINALAKDNSGNLWIGLQNNGVSKLMSEAVVNFIPRRDDSKIVGDVLETDDGKIWAMLINGFPAVIENGELVEREFDLPLPSSISALFSKNKDGWVYSAQNQTLRLKSPRLRMRNERIIDVSKYIDSLTEGCRFYEDEQETFWIAKRDGKLYRGRSDNNGEFVFESFKTETPFSFFGSRITSDGSGGIWLSHPLFLDRFRNGEYSPVKISDGLPEIDPRSIFKDSRGWLWIGHRNKGVSVTKEPAAENPVFFNYSKTSSPLSSNAVRSIVEDNEGRMYFATDRGLDRFDLEENKWLHLSEKTGLSGNLILGVIKDKKGFIWAATDSGLSRVDSNLDKTSEIIPPIYLTSINIAGKDLNLPLSGLAEIQKMELNSDENNLSIEYVAPNFRDENFNYQHRFENDNSEWSKPTKERAISFSLLPAGSYRFEVRAINQNGVTSLKPASFEFQILPPIWQRWWFVLGVISLIGLSIYWLYRIRIARLLEVERTRTRIATDLHDDIGTNLSKISLLSEIVKMQLGNENEERSRMLQVIGDASRESVGAMSDIVWSINPGKDSLADITRRMRQHLDEVFLEKDVKKIFNAPEDGKDRKLSMEVRREFYLIFKEAVNNIAKHSGCTEVVIDFEVEQNNLFLQIKDNGKGFDTANNSNGNGLQNMKLRAKRINAIIEIVSESNRGTTITVRLKNL